MATLANRTLCTFCGYKLTQCVCDDPGRNPAPRSAVIACSIITPKRRELQGQMGAFDAAVRQARLEYRLHSSNPKNRANDFRLTLAVVRLD
jgi:hypothetical protein